MFRSTTVAALLTLLLALPALGQPLADRLPADTLLYIGWKGIGPDNQAYQQSHLKAVLDATDTQRLEQLVTQAMQQRLEQQADPDAQLGMTLLRAIAELSRERETALVVTGLIQPDDADAPRQKAALLWRAGDDVEAVRGQLEELVAQLPEEARPHISVFTRGDLAGVGLGSFDPASLDAQGAKLATSERFTGALAQAGEDPQLVAWLDVAGALAAAKEIAPPGQWEQAAPVIESLGLGGVEHAIYSAGFVDRNWQSHVHVAAPQPRSGLVALFEAEPVDTGMLDMAPQSASWVTLKHMDLGALVDSLRRITNELPQAAGQVDMIMGIASMQLGIDVEGQVLDPLGPQWLVYADNSVIGMTGFGLAVINTLADEPKARETLDAVVERANQIAQMQQEMGQLDPANAQGAQPAVKKMQVAGVDVYTTAQPGLVQPAVAISGDGRLIVTTLPNAVASIVNSIEDEGGITQSESYQAAMQGLPVDRATTITYVDLPQSAPRMYGLLMMSLGQAGNLVPELRGVTAMMPTLNELRPHLSPAVTVKWNDEQGFHARSIEPFPGSRALGAPGNNLSLAKAAIVLPALGAAIAQQQGMASPMGGPGMAPPRPQAQPAPQREGPPPPPR